MFDFLTQYTSRKRRHTSFWMFFVILIGSLDSCIPIKNTFYFKNLTKDTLFKAQPVPTLEAKIQKNDILGITVSSLSNELDAKFNESAITSVPVVGAQGAGGKGFLVGDDGKILMHFLGNVKVDGLTRKQLKTKLQQDLLPYMKEPIVSVEFLNKKVIIMGEVSGPKIVPIPEEKISLLDLLISNGGILDKGDKSKVIIIRDTGDNKQVKLVDLEDHNIFSSPWFYLKPNDIVYVKTDEQSVKLQNRDRGRADFQFYFGFVNLALSLTFFVLNFFR
ncbi:MAG: hypothetical protein FGM46_03705 [Ferruginibacter sp.]|nr:hypothetical protein [Ferruginibacter sp.]